MKTKMVLILVGLCAAPVASAQDARLQALDHAAKIMNQCAAIAKKIAAIPAPPGQGAAAVAGNHQEMRRQASEKAGGAERSEAATAARKKSREDYEKSLTQQQLAFMRHVGQGRDELSNCGREYEKIHVSSHALAEKLARAMAQNKKPGEDDKRMGAAVMAYMSAGKNLVTEIAALSKDIETQRYVARVINRYFLGTEDDAGKPVAKK